MPNPLAMRLRMTPQMDAYNDAYSEWMPQNPAEAQLYYQAMQMLQAMPQDRQPATDWENDENLRRFMQAAGSDFSPLPPGMPPSQQTQWMWARPEVGEQRLWQYAQEGGGPTGPADMPAGIGDIGYEVSEEEVRGNNWKPVREFIDEAARMRAQLPEPLRLKLDRVLRSMK